MRRYRPISNLAIRYNNRNYDPKFNDEEMMEALDQHIADDSIQSIRKRKRIDKRVMDNHFCKTCKVEYEIDRAQSIYVCPSCGNSERFSAYMFHWLDHDKVGQHKPPPAINVENLRKYLEQYTTTYPEFPDEVVDHCVEQSLFIHTNRRNKVTNSNIRKDILPKLPKEMNIGKTMVANAVHRLGQTIRGDPIPLLTPDQMQKILQEKYRMEKHKQQNPGDTKWTRLREVFTHNISKQLGFPIYVLFPCPKA